MAAPRTAAQDLGVGTLDLSDLLAQFAPQANRPPASAAPSSSSAPLAQTPVAASTSDTIAQSIRPSTLDSSTSNDVAVNLFPSTPGTAPLRAPNRLDLLSVTGELHASVLDNPEGCL